MAGVIPVTRENNMQARRIREVDVHTERAVTRRGLTLVHGNAAARGRMTRRDGRIRLVRSVDDERRRDKDSVERAHARLKLPSLEAWLQRRFW